MTQEEKYKYMTQEPIPKLIGKLAVPTIISMLVTSFYNIADTYFVGKINTTATAAVGVVFSLMAIIQALGFLFGHGSGNYISRKLGGQDLEDASLMASCGFFYSLICGFLLLIAGYIFVEPLARFLGSTDTILPYAVDYMRLILVGAPYMTASLVLNNQLRFQGSAMYGMIGIVTGAVLNIGLDPLLIFHFDMGIAGAAWATIISQFVSFCLLLAGTLRGNNIKIHPRNFRFSGHYLYEIFRGGFPSLCRQGIASVAAICLNHSAGFYGDAAIAAMSIVNRIMMFANSALIGFGQGFQPVCGFNYGAKLYGRVREGFVFCVKYSLIFLIIAAGMGIYFAADLVALFRKDDMEVIEVGTMALRATCLSFPLNAWIVMSNMMLQSVGEAFKASVLAAARQGLFFLPFLFILEAGLGLTGIEITQPIADVCTLLLSIPICLSFLKKMKEKEKKLNKDGR